MRMEGPEALLMGEQIQDLGPAQGEVVLDDPVPVARSGGLTVDRVVELVDDVVERLVVLVPLRRIMFSAC